MNLVRPLIATCVALCLSAAVLPAVLPQLASAVGQTRNAPLPPPRPSTLGQPPAPSAQTPAPAPQQTTAEEPLDLDHPPMLPAASRERMSACGREWQAIKKAGKDVDIGWREFATRCLTR